MSFLKIEKPVNHEIEFPPRHLKNREKKHIFSFFNNKSKDISRVLISLISIAFVIQGAYQVDQSTKLEDASIGTFDAKYDYTYDKFKYQIGKFAFPLALTGVCLIFTSIFGICLVRKAYREYGIAYGFLTITCALVLFVYSKRL